MGHYYFTILCSRRKKIKITLDRLTIWKNLLALTKFLVTSMHLYICSNIYARIVTKHPSGWCRFVLHKMAPLPPLCVTYGYYPHPQKISHYRLYSSPYGTRRSSDLGQRIEALSSTCARRAPLGFNYIVHRLGMHKTFSVLRPALFAGASTTPPSIASGSPSLSGRVPARMYYVLYINPR